MDEFCDGYFANDTEVENYCRKTYTDKRRMTRTTGYNITYTQAGFSCFVGQESGKFGVQFFVVVQWLKSCLRIAENRCTQS